ERSPPPKFPPNMVVPPIYATVTAGRRAAPMTAAPAAIPQAPEAPRFCAATGPSFPKDEPISSGTDVSLCLRFPNHLTQYRGRCLFWILRAQNASPRL